MQVLEDLTNGLFFQLLNGDETDNSKKFNKKNKKESDRDEEIDTVKDEKLKKVIQIKKDNQEDSIDEASVSEVIRFPFRCLFLLT